MRFSSLVPSKVSCFFILAGLALPACSSSTDVGPTVYVDVSLSAGCPTPATVRLQIMQGAAKLAEKSFAWPAAGGLKAGVQIASGSTGNVTVSGTGLDTGGNPVAQGGPIDAIVGGASVSLVLSATVAPSPDGGTDAQPPVGDAGTPDSGTPDVVSGLEIGAPDVPGAEHLAADVAGDLPGDFPGAPDLPGGEVLADGPGDAAAGSEVSSSDAINDAATGDAAPASRSWSTPIQLKDQGDSSYTPAVAMDPVRGNAVVVWADTTIGVRAFAYSAANDKWSPAISISNDPDTTLAKVGADGTGRFFAVWSRQVNSPTEPDKQGIWASFSTTEGLTWSKPVQLWSGGAKHWAMDLQLAMGRKGQAMVVWDESQNPNTLDFDDKLYAVFIDGTANQPAAAVAAERGDIAFSVAIDGAGNGVIVWSAPDTTVQKQSIWAATFAKQVIATPALIESYDAGDCDYPAVGMDSAGQAIALWIQSSSSAGEIWARRYSVTTGWASTPELVVRASMTGSISAVALDTYGGANVGTSRWSSGGFQATYCSQPIGGTWNAEYVESGNKAPAFTTTDTETQVAVDGSGNVLVGYRKKISDNEFVPHFRWKNGTTWGADVEVGKILDLFADYMQVAVADDGRAIAAWSYLHCGPDSKYADQICPTGKAFKDLSAEATAALGVTHVSLYK